MYAAQISGTDPAPEKKLMCLFLLKLLLNYYKITQGADLG